MRNATLASTSDTAIPVRLDLQEEFGWRRHQLGAATLWSKGYLHGEAVEAAAERIAGAEDSKLPALLAALNGHFTLVIEAPDRIVAVVDRVRSIPLFVASGGAGYVIGDRASRLQNRLGSSFADTNTEAALLIGMSGYTLGGKTLDKRIEQIQPGHFAIWHGDKVGIRRYHAWQPWRIVNRPAEELGRQLADVTLDILGRMAASIGDRVIAVPLSAGLDSRLIASGLHRLGIRNVKCFSYGLTGNYEAEAGRQIAERLGYDWNFVPLSPAIQRETFASADNRAYIDFADTLASVPFQQDFHAIRALRDSGWLPKDAVVVNGQTGDFISGAHIPKPLYARQAAGPEKRWEAILDALIAKHYGLWGWLKTPENLALVRRCLREDIAAVGGELGAAETDHGLYEISEFRNRQCKYVITGQRIYEFLGVDWRLPLWDNAYLDFWESVPVTEKGGQRLYRRMLEEQNWGGVWQGWDFPRKVSPRWLAPIRLAAKAVLAPRGRRYWHDFERRRFAYPMDVVSNYAIAPYGRVASDRRGHRNAISWHAEAYLARKGLALDGHPIAIGQSA